MSKLLSRRYILRLLAGLLSVQAATAFADDDGGDGGDDNSGSGGNREDNDRDDDDNNRDDNDHDDDRPEKQDKDEKDDKSSGRRNSNSNHTRSEQDRALDAVTRGKAVPLKRVLSHCKANFEGKVLDVKIRKREKRLVYEVRMLLRSNLVRTIRLDAKTLKKL